MVLLRTEGRQGSHDIGSQAAAIRPSSLANPRLRPDLAYVVERLTAPGIQLTKSDARDEGGKIRHPKRIRPAGSKARPGLDMGEKRCSR
jgi:hypothetical protein